MAQTPQASTLLWWGKGWVGAKGSRQGLNTMYALDRHGSDARLTGISARPDAGRNELRAEDEQRRGLFSAVGILPGGLVTNRVDRRALLRPGSSPLTSSDRGTIRSSPSRLSRRPGILLPSPSILQPPIGPLGLDNRTARSNFSVVLSQIPARA